MKVGINARTFSTDEPGGAVQAAIRLTRELATNGVNVVLFGHSSIESLFPHTTIDGQGYVTSSRAYGVFWERTVLPFLADKHSVDLLFCPNGNGPLHELSVPVVMQIHDVNALKGYSSQIHQTYRKLTVPRAARTADGIVTVSEFSKREINSHLGIPNSKIHVVYNGVDECFREPPSSPVDLPDPYILFVGAMNPRKNLERLVRAFVRLKETRDVPHKLVLIGPEDDVIFKNVDIEERPDIVTPGYLNREELKSAYCNADLFAYPSLYEGFGLPPLEAMACGTPVVASNTSSLPEVLNGAAHLVDPRDTTAIADAMAEVLTDTELQSDLIERGYERSVRYNWNDAGEDLVGVFDECI